jgi:hypothetical protein
METRIERGDQVFLYGKDYCKDHWVSASADFTTACESLCENVFTIKAVTSDGVVIDAADSHFIWPISCLEKIEKPAFEVGEELMLCDEVLVLYLWPSCALVKYSREVVEKYQSTVLCFKGFFSTDPRFVILNTKNDDLDLPVFWPVKGLTKVEKVQVDEYEFDYGHEANSEGKQVYKAGDKVRIASLQYIKACNEGGVPSWLKPEFVKCCGLVGTVVGYPKGEYTSNIPVLVEGSSVIRDWKCEYVSPVRRKPATPIVVSSQDEEPKVYSREAVQEFLQQKVGSLVEHPSHYNQTQYEVMEVLDAWFPDNPLLWQVVKYLVRAKYKGNYKQDLEKAKFYLEREIKKYENI